jgi:serine/threonine-protein kinase RsbW
MRFRGIRARSGQVDSLDTSRLRLPAKLENLEYFVVRAASCAARLGFTKKRIGEIELAVEEAIVNICSYAYQGEAGDIEMMCKANGSNFIIDIEDDGKPFNILDLPEPDVTAGIMERQVRGLGVLLIKKFIDEVYYNREVDKNKLSLVVRLSAANH